MSGIVCPSYQAGFASPQRGRLAYPQLWRGCVGAWAPCLGQSGTTLRDNSGYGNHGTLTNMDPATDWVVSGGKQALDFNGTDDVIVARHPSIAAASAFSVSCWCHPVGYGGGLFGRLFDWASITGFFVQSFGGKNGFRGLLNNTPVIDYDVPGGLLNNSFFVVIVVEPVPARTTLYLNGQSVSVGGYADPGSLSNVWLGNRSAGDRGFDGRLDDFRVYSAALRQRDITLLATSRGSAYETVQRRSYKSAAAPPASTANNLMLLGVG